MAASLPENIGRYRVRSRLGRGGMGTVYLAFDPQLDRLVALKLFHEIDDDGEARQRFEREARSGARLAHPNIVTIYDIGEDHGRLFIAMEYAPGETLAEVIRRGAPMTIADKLAIADAIAAGLDHAHRSGLVHRDVKPTNVIIGRDGEVKLLDFGIAKLVNESGMTRHGMLIGSPGYMSPEQVNGQPVDQRTDIFALGVVLYELLTGEQPFAGDITTAVRKILHDDPPRVSERRPEVPASLDEVVGRALEKDPVRRYQDLASLRRDLARVRDSDQDNGAPDALSLGAARTVRQSPPPEQRRHERRNTWLAAAHAALDRQDHAEAAALAEQALLLDPDDAAALAIVEHATALAERDQEAERLQREAAAEQQRREDREQRTAAILAEAERSLREGALDSAVRAINEALAFEPEHPGALALLRRCELHGTPVPPLLAPTIQTPTPEVLAEPNPRSDPGTVIFQPPPRSARGGMASQVGARLVVMASPDPRMMDKSFELGTGRFTIGRADDADLRSTDPRWSRRSAEIHYRDGGFFITDVSTNGVVVNGSRLTSGGRPLLYGDQIAIGATLLRFAPAGDLNLPDLSGSTIGGRYVLDSLLRESTKGPLYAARLINLPRRVAIKLLSPYLVQYPGYRERFKRRAEINSQLHHPHICRINDFGDTEVRLADGTSVETAFLALDLMTGGSLADRLVEREPIALPTVERWLQLLAEALDYAHSSDALHGDLKPAAVVFDGAGNPYLSDFGAERGLAGEVVVGTPAYMAPEQWEGADFTPQTDQFGLAVLAYCLIAGTVPFEGQDHPEIRRRNFARGPLPAHEEARRNGRDGVSAQVSAVLERGLALAPDARHASVREFVDRLAGALHGRDLVRDPNQPPRVFLSYQRGPSTGWAVHLAEQLQEKHGIDVFIDLQRVDAAVKFPDRLARAIEGADVFLCLLGPTTTKSDWVRHEVRLAHQYRKPMIPIFQDGYVASDEPVSDQPFEALFSYDGIHLIDMYREYAIGDLAKRIGNTVKGPSRS